jgi:Holliday junction DNA helicase RuvB
MIGEGPAARSVQIDLPPFTLVGATTRSGLISSPLRDRFGIPVRLIFYTPEELQSVLLRGARALHISLSSEGAIEIARRSRGTPRIALRLLKRIRDFVLVDGDSEITARAADSALLHLEVDGQGLDAMDHRYLKHIIEHFEGGPVGLETLAAALAEQKDTLEDVIEPYLLQQGYIQRTPRGRMLTPRAYEIFGYSIPHQLQSSLFEEKNE